MEGSGFVFFVKDSSPKPGWNEAVNHQPSGRPVSSRVALFGVSVT